MPLRQPRRLGYVAGVSPPQLSPASAQKSTRFARERDARIRWLLDTHPVTAAMLVRVGWFPTKNKALRRLNRLVERGRVRLVGTVRRKTGRPEHVFCRWRPKVDQLLHEVELTDLCLRLDAGRILRGPQVTDSHIRPDAEVWINGRLYYVELDRATTGSGKIERDRFRKYDGCPHLSLWVCPTEVRRETLRAKAAGVRAGALFATFAEAMATPHGPVWLDFGGGRAALPREKDRGLKPGK